MARKRSRKGQQQSMLARLPRGSSGVIIATAVLAVLSLWLLAGLVSQVITGARQEREISAQRQVIATYQADVAALGTQVAYATSPAYAEQVAREQLGYARDGDTVVLPSFPQVTPTIDNPTPVAAPTVAHESNLNGWVKAFFPPSATPTPVP